MNEKKIALVTGGNRGLGLATCQALATQGYKVFLASRDETKGREKAKELQQNNLDVTSIHLDVADSKSLLEVYHHIKGRESRLDVLINNAAVLLDKEEGNPTDINEIKKRLLGTLETNVVGPYQLSELFFPLMSQQKYGRIVNVSSGLGQLSQEEEAFPTYSISKTALNGVTKIFAARGRDKNILVNSVDPGWVKTDMGGDAAPRSIEQGIETIVWAATLPDGGPTGKFLRDKQPMAW